ncbi:MAG: hypothetical protein U0V70_20155 [Terriglobia bacterium]
METPAFLLKLKAIGLEDLYHIQGFMHLLMKPRNGMRWTTEDKQELRTHLMSLAESLPYLAVFSLPGGLLLLPLLARILDRRKPGQARFNTPNPPNPSAQQKADPPTSDPN